jgi:uncharacterized protein YfeS
MCPTTDWDVLDENQIRRLLDADNGFAVLTRDDFIVGLAFAQLLLEGTVDPTVKSRALAALARQGTELVLTFRGCGGEDARRKQLAEFRRILEVS